jgi:hypothetical protein
MDKVVKTPYIESCKYLDGCVVERSANLEDSDYISNYGIHIIDDIPEWYNEKAIDLYKQDWITTNELNNDIGYDVEYSLDDADGYTKAFYSVSKKFKQMKL